MVVVSEFVAARVAERSFCVAVGVIVVRVLEDGSAPVVISGRSGWVSFPVSFAPVVRWLW
ncbi:unnamed protein product [Arabidopsis lyrata]|nr:unnamed protein product [Arabidopsis lyrata]